MKKQSSLLLILMLLLVLAGCGAKSAPTEPPELTVTNAQGVSITAMGGSYDWDYDAGGGQRTGAIARWTRRSATARRLLKCPSRCRRPSTTR